ncbi:MAG TPA: pyrroloquinoline quinone biosynthesis protein PqqB [Steroidobacteraceae bacterium]|nr:pyrroloquinoline quinone biosynthesis protein PqqB [Steroidobacteraceae bacterium]
MKIRILGSAAGGGFPQWNCNCRNCRGVREGTLRARARTQSSLVVRGKDAHAWALVNASPDVLTQLRSHADLQPGRSIRDSAIRAIVLMDGQIDHVTGLLMLRESQRAWPLWTTDAVFNELSRELPLLDVLAHYCDTAHHRIDLDRSFTIEGIDDVAWRATILDSKAPPYSRDRLTPVAGSNIALTLTDTHSGRTAFYAPGLGVMSAALWEAMSSADLVLVDGTCWRDDELQVQGISSKRSRDMGHLPLKGAGGMIEWLSKLPASTRKVLVHINNTNPILDEDSVERTELAAFGIDVGHDGMEWDL